MSTATIRRVRCDLCGFVSSSAEIFTQVAGHDFCRWCTSGPTRRTECGGHTVDLADGSWSCSCGATMADVVSTLRTHGAGLQTMDAVPHLDSATAAIHVQTPDWPRTW